MKALDLSGHTALVTGGARRIGRAICLALAKAGSKVVVHYRESRAEAQQLAGEIESTGVRAFTIRADLGVPEELNSLIARARESAGELDVLVNNSSIFPPSDFATFGLRDLHENIELNAYAPLALARDFAGATDHGSIVNMLDARIVGYDWSHVAYHSSKHLLALFTRMMAIELAPAITVNAVAPGLILPPEGKDASYLESLKDRVPLKRVGSAEAVANAVLFLLASDYITGQVIFVDGGRHLTEASVG